MNKSTLTRFLPAGCRFFLFSLFFIFFIFFLFLLAGCSDLNSDFSCPMQPGHYCKSLSQINQMVDRGEIANPDHKNNLLKTNVPMRVWLPDQGTNAQTAGSVIYY